MGISTHVLDTAAGRPAVALAVALEVQRGDEWVLLSQDKTDAEGRCRAVLPDGVAVEPGTYRLRFHTAAWFASTGAAGLYPVVEITFTVRDAAENFHLPLLLTANGFTTYRGS